MDHSLQSRHQRTAGHASAAGLTRYGKAAIVLIAAIPMLATIGYGAVDIWAIIPLSLLTALLIVLWTADSLKTGTLTFSMSELQLPIIGLILIGGIQLLPFGNSGVDAVLADAAATSLTADPFATKFFIIRLGLLLVFFAAALRFLNGKRLVQWVTLSIIIFGSVMAFAGILQRLTSPDAIYGMRPTPQAIPFGPFVNQHHFAALMEMIVGVTLASLLGGALKRDKKALLLIALSLMLIAVIMIGSRGGFIGMFAVFGFVLIATYWRGGHAAEPRAGGNGLKLAAGIAFVLLTAVGAVLFLSGADPLVRGLGMEVGVVDITSGRTHFWSVAWKIFLDNPVLGAGLDAFGIAFTRYDTWNGIFRVEQAHNDYLQILADAGIVGFVLVAAFIFLFFRRGLAVIRRSTNSGRRSIAIGAMAGCFGIMVHSFFDFPLRTPSNSYFFLMLAVLATAELGDEQEITT